METLFIVLANWKVNEVEKESNCVLLLYSLQNIEKNNKKNNNTKKKKKNMKCHASRVFKDNFIWKKEKTY